MSSKINIGLVAIIAALAGLVTAKYFFVPDKYPAFLSSPKTVITLDGETLTADKIKDKVVMVNFWATTCIICIKEMPKFVKLYEDYKNKDFKLIAIALAYDEEKAVRKFRDDKNLNFEIVHDVNNQLAETYKIIGTPTTFLFDKSSRQKNIWLGEIDNKNLRREIDNLLTN